MRTRKPHSVTSIGYLGQKAALTAVEQHEVISLATGTCRIAALREVKRFVNLFTEGNVLKLTLRRKTFQGTLLGYKWTENRGWVMGFLSTNGDVRDVTIDPKGYERCDEFMEVMEDRSAKYICLVTPYESILQVSPL